MGFGARLFWTILGVGLVLVAAMAVATGLVSVQGVETQAAADLSVGRKSATRLFAELTRELDRIAEALSSKALEDAVGEAETVSGATALRITLAGILDEMDGPPPFVSFRGPLGEAWFRRTPGHACTAECDHATERWVSESANIVVEIESAPYALSAVRYGDARLYFGLPLAAELDHQADELKGGLVVTAGGRIVHADLPMGIEDLPEGDRASFAGTDFLVARLDPEGWDASIHLFRPAGRSGHVAAVIGISAGIGVLLALAGALAASAAMERAFARRLEEAKRMAPVVPRAVKVREEPPPPPDRREVTMLFMETRGFGAAGDAQDPSRVVGALNAVIERAAGAIARHGGIVASFQADGLMAMFGAPKPLPDHARKGLEAALEILHRFDRWKASHAAERDAPGGVAVGVHTGIVVGGSVGMPGRSAYTLFGEEVHVAARICAEAGSGQALASRRTVEAASYAVRATGRKKPLHLAGSDRMVVLFEVIRQDRDSLPGRETDG